MSSRSKRTLSHESSLLRRSPRLSSKEPPERRKPTPSRAAKPMRSIFEDEPLKTVGSQVTANFSEDDEISDESTKTSFSNLSIHQKWSDKLWNSLLNAKDKSREQFSRNSWTKRNLFAVFVLIPIIFAFLLLSVWNINEGLPFLNFLNFVSWPTFPMINKYFSTQSSHPGFDVDSLIDKILANDKFNELVTASSTDSDKVMYFAKDKLAAMEKELKETNEALIREMNEKLNKAKAKIDDLKNIEDFEEIRKQIEGLKNAIDQREGSSEEVETLKLKIQELLQKHEELSVQLANCQNQGQVSRDQLEQDLVKALKEALLSNENDLMTKQEFTSKMAETQHDLLFGIESKVLDKVRSDPVIMEKMTILARQTGQQFSKDDVVSIVNEALTVYDADKTGLFDFALESAGGTIASIRCTETYDVTRAVYHIMGVPFWWERKNPRLILQPDSSPGQCWAFKGAQGCVVVKLSNPVFITDVTLEHIPKNLSPDGTVSSAPKQFEVLGLDEVDDPQPFHLGNFTYDIENAKNPVQTFKVTNLPSPLRPFQFVELRILSNFGHPDYTCLYRFRVHGSLQ